MGGKVLDLPSFRAYDAGVEEGIIKGDRARAIKTYQNCIDRGMSKEDAIAISEIDEKDIPEV